MSARDNDKADKTGGTDSKDYYGLGLLRTTITMVLLMRKVINMTVMNMRSEFSQTNCSRRLVYFYKHWRANFMVSVLFCTTSKVVDDVVPEVVYLISIPLLKLKNKIAALGVVI